MNIVVQICCFRKCGIVSKGFNPHLTFGNHLLGNVFYFFIGTRGFFAFSIAYTIDEGVQKSSLVFNSDLEGVC